MTRNRPDYLFESALSALNQVTTFNYKVFISNNGDEIKDYRLLKFKNLEIINRPNLSVYDHFNTILSECDTEFITVFHDDDLLESNYVEFLISKFKSNPNTIAIGTNARIRYEDSVSRILYINSTHGTVDFSSPTLFIQRYFEILGDGIAPFPSFMYRKSLLNNIQLSLESGGKYSDLFFLSSLISDNKVITYINQPLIQYRVHHSNDTKYESTSDRLLLLRRIRSTYNLTNNDDSVRQMRLKIWLFYCFKILSTDLFSFFSIKKPILKFIIFNLVHFFLFNPDKLLNFFYRQLRRRFAFIY